EVVIVEGLGKQFGERTLFSNIDLLIARGERIGIVGPNGAGKSTFVRILMGRENPTAGCYRLGANVTVGYFAQEASDLDPESTVIEHMFGLAGAPELGGRGAMLPEEARTHLGAFLFTGDDVF